MYYQNIFLRKYTKHHAQYDTKKITTINKVTTVDTSNIQPGELVHMDFSFLKRHFRPFFYLRDHSSLSKE